MKPLCKSTIFNFNKYKTRTIIKDKEFRKLEMLRLKEYANLDYIKNEEMKDLIWSRDKQYIRNFKLFEELNFTKKQFIPVVLQPKFQLPKILKSFRSPSETNSRNKFIFKIENNKYNNVCLTEDCCMNRLDNNIQNKNSKDSPASERKVKFFRPIKYKIRRNVEYQSQKKKESKSMTKLVIKDRSFHDINLTFK